MAVPTVSHPPPNFGASFKRVTPVASATLPPNLPLLGDLIPQQAQTFGVNTPPPAPNASLASPLQPFARPSDSPQPFQAAKSSPTTPAPAVKPSDVTSSAPAPANSAVAPSATPTPPKMAPVVAGIGTLPETASAAASGSGAASSFSATDSLRAIPTNKNNPAFLNKLRSMVDDPNTDELIRWSPDGASFFVPNHVRFGDEVLPRFFKHNRFSSFVRQLNMYGFHKVPHLQQGALKHDSPQESELWEFSNPHFHRDHPDWLSKVQRKKGPRDDKDANAEREQSVSTGQELMHAGALMRTDFGANSVGVDGSGEGALQLASVLNAINAIKNAQTSISADLRHLQNSNQNLWQEAVESRQRAKRQQETINKILRFLAGVFGNQDDAETPVAGKKVPGKGRGGRRVGVRPQQQQRSKSRLMIEDGSESFSHSAGLRGIEALDLPLDQEEIEEMPSHLRFQDASNADSSPRTQSPSANTGGSRFTQIGSPPSSAADFGRQLSEAVSTPGGSRRLSSQASNQVLNALASGEGNAWLASLFGASLANQGSKSTGPASGGGLKLDPHMVAALQQALASAGSGGGGGGAGGVNGASDGNADYFGGSGNAPADDFSSRFSTFPSALNASSSSSASTQPSSSSGTANGLGLDADALARIAGLSQALVQSPARQNANAGSSINQQSNYSLASPSRGQSANLFDLGNDDLTSSSNNQLALSLSRASRDLQNTSGDVDQVQNSINSLIEGLQTNPALLQSIAGQGSQAGGAAAGVPWQTTGADAGAGGAGFGAFGDATGAAPTASIGQNQFGGPTGTTPPSASADANAASATSGTAPIDTDFDVDSFLSQFVDSSQAPGGGVSSPSNAYGESPSFAFSPATTAAFLHGAGVNDTGMYGQLAENSDSSGSPVETGSGGAGKKRKPSGAGVGVEVDTMGGARPAKKAGRKG
ncbi:DNA binding transcription factor [Pseudozyma hubeiensis SY62]|uniref:DNA binding transcription factor n=1 Tax=Pseudozyma hubeiensis (strain SY62) TaxID=1305764 RepID=R9P8E1_PSEHS|nr:DNA binding transcription factor [Pseudozyma hubeiensis SY62]GAC97641.1 DNA binding transcription factor [Pseudozyma hubeiensis SY62]